MTVWGCRGERWTVWRGKSMYRMLGSWLGCSSSLLELPGNLGKWNYSNNCVCSSMFELL